MLLLIGFAHDAAEKIYQAIVFSRGEAKILLPVPRPYETIGSTRYVDFDTAREVYRTAENKCQVSHVVLDSGWEAKMAEVLEELDEVRCYVKNYQLGFSIPYTFNGEEKQYLPDYLLRVVDGHGTDDLLNLIVEVSGEARKDKAAKVAAARNLWIPAVNNHGGWGRWAFIEIVDPWDAMNTLRAFLKGEKSLRDGPLFNRQ